MSCEKYQQYIIPYAEGTLSITMMEEMAAHLLDCTDCQHELDEIIETIGILRETEYPQIEPAVNLRSRVMAQIADDTPARKPWWRMNLTTLSAAAGLMFICVFMVIYSKGGAPGSKAMQMQDAIQSAVVSTGSVPASVAGQRKASDAVTLAARPAGDTQESTRLLPGSIASTTPSKPVANDNKAASVRTFEKPVLMAKVEPGNKYQNSESDRMYLPEKADTTENVPLMSKSIGTAEGITKQRIADDRQMFNSMIPGGAQNQQQNSSLNAAPTQNNLQDKTTKSGLGGSVPVNEAIGSQKQADEDILTLERKLAAFPNSVTVMKKLLERYRTTGRSDDEYAIAVKLTKVDPNNPGYWFARGQAAERVKMPKTAVTCYQTAIKKNLSGADLELAKSRLEALGK